MKVNFNRIVIKQEAEWALNLITSLVQCKICLNILNDPCDCMCCYQTFCKKCITDYIMTNKKCPYSNYLHSESKEYFDEKGTGFNEDAQAKQLIENLRSCTCNINSLITALRFSCDYKNNGCNDELSLKEIEEHLVKCKYKTAVMPKQTYTELHLPETKDKFKFQDSCMSFQKVDIADVNAYNCNQQQFNYRLMEKIDHMTELITSMTKEPKPIQSNDNASSLKQMKQSIGKCSSPSNIKDNYLKTVETPKFRSRQQVRDVSNTNTIHILSNRLQLLTNKITGIERTMQTVSSFKTQQYSVQNINSNSSSNSTFHSNNHISCKPLSPNRGVTSTKANIQTSSGSIEQSTAIINKIASEKETSAEKRKNFSKSIIFTPKNPERATKSNSFAKRNYMSNHTFDRKDCARIWVKEAHSLSSDELEKLLSHKDDSLRKFLEEKVVSTLIEHIDDLNSHTIHFIERKVKESKEAIKDGSDIKEPQVIDNELKAKS